MVNSGGRVEILWFWRDIEPWFVDGTKNFYLIFMLQTYLYSTNRWVLGLNLASIFWVLSPPPPIQFNLPFLLFIGTYLTPFIYFAVCLFPSDSNCKLTNFLSYITSYQSIRWINQHFLTRMVYNRWHHLKNKNSKGCHWKKTDGNSQSKLLIVKKKWNKVYSEVFEFVSMCNILFLFNKRDSI